MTKFNNLDALLANNDQNRSIIVLDNFIAELCSYGDEMDKLTEPQKQFYYNQCLEREVNNGGFELYFYNSSGNFAHQTIQSLNAIGATTTSDILQKAIDQFPDKKVPPDRIERVKLVDQIKYTASAIWDELDTKFYEYVDDLNTLNLNYVRLHKAEF